jgi:hypothetical protein
VTPCQRWCLLLILTTGLAVRLGWAWVQPSSAAAINQLPDQREYLEIAHNFLYHGGLWLFDPRFNQTVVAYRLPGYSFVVAACGCSARAVRLVQAGVDTSTILAVFLLARQLSRSVPGALLAAAAIALNPFQIYFSGLVLTETTFAAAVTWGAVAAVRRAMPATVILFVVALYLRPTALVLGPIVAMAAANCCGQRPYKWKPALLLTLALVVALLPWAARNEHRLGVPIWTTTNDGITFYDGFHEGATGASDQRFVAGLPALRSMNEVERSRDLTRRARRWVTDHPGELIGLSFRKIARGWSPVPLSAEFGRPLYRWVGGGYAVPFDLLCLIGLVSRRVGWRAKGVLLAPAVVLTAVQVITVGSIRYRVPAEPSLAVLAGVGAVAVWARARRWFASSVVPDHAVAGHHSSPPVRPALEARPPVPPPP